MAWKEKKWFRFLVTSLAVVAGALMQAYVVQTFVEPAGLLSGGFTGIAILVKRIGEIFHVNIPLAVTLVGLNVPVALLCCRGISVRFTAFSLALVFLNSIFLETLHFEPLFDDIILNVIFGGFLNGLSIAVALKGNASTGGTDFIALYISNKTGKSIWNYVFVFNAALLCVFGLLFGWHYAGYSILFQYISTKTISAFHHRYDRVTIQATTQKGEEIVDSYVKHFKHGISSTEAVGGYSKQKMNILYTVVSAYEVADVLLLMRHIDPHIIINTFKTSQFVGKFYQKPIE